VQAAMHLPTCYPEHRPVGGVELQHGEGLVPLPGRQGLTVTLHPLISSRHHPRQLSPAHAGLCPHRPGPH
jgi:hypothetical protein